MTKASPKPRTQAKPKGARTADPAGLRRALARLYPGATCALAFETPLQLLVATILSAQCTDARVNTVTPALFARCRTAQDFATIPTSELIALIKSTGFFNNKAKAIQEACAQIHGRFGGEVPRTMDELLTLRGVARKTANVILGTAFGMNEGIVVDTHVIRLANRMGLTAESDPVKIEQDLMRAVPREEWTRFGHRMTLHGRQVCTARRPACDQCACLPACAQVGV